MPAAVQTLSLAALLWALTWASVTPASTQPRLDVMTSGAFSAPYRKLAPEFERTAGIALTTVEGASMGDAPTTIPNRLKRREPADVVILARGSLDDLVKAGLVTPGSEVDLVRSLIGMAVRAGTPSPDISTKDAFVQTVLAAKSIGVGPSASGVYLTKELFPALGLADRMLPKTRRIDDGPVAVPVARGEVEIGFQQMSELIPVPGITIVGPLPSGVQRATLFSAGIVSGTRNVEGARALIRYFTSAGVADTIRQAGLEPLTMR